MTLTKYRTTKLPEYHFKQIEAVLARSERYVSVADFLRSAIEEKLDAERRRGKNHDFLLLKDIVFTRSRLAQIHDAIAETSRVDSNDVLKKDIESVVERSLDIDMNRFIARFLFNFMKYHPFKDGNKRASFVAADVFLRLNNMKLVLDVKKSAKTTDEKFIWKISTQQKIPDEIETFLEKHTKHYLTSNDFDIELKKCLQENRQLLENLSE